MSKTAPETVNQFIADALPADGHQNVLAVGELHTQVDHVHFLKRRLGTLKNKQNLGAIGLERPLWMDVFTFAYRDGKLPVPPEMQGKYIHMLYRVFSNSKENADAQADLIEEAVRQRIDVVDFDSRDSFAEIRPKYVEWIKGWNKLFTNDPALREKICTDPAALEKAKTLLIESSPAIQADIRNHNYSAASAQTFAGYALAITEAERLFDRKCHPQYHQWLENTDALVLAGNQAHMGRDAISAAVLRYSAPSGKNIISFSGLYHIMGITDPKTHLKGTFANHLQHMSSEDAGKTGQVTTAIIASTRELNAQYGPYFSAGGDIFRSMAKSGLREHQTYRLPHILVTNRDATMPVIHVSELNGGRYPKGSPEAWLKKIKDAYRPEPGPVVSNAQYVDLMQRKLEKLENENPEMFDKVTESRQGLRSR